MVLDKKKTGGENFLKKVFSPRPPLSKTFDVIESLLAVVLFMSSLERCWMIVSSAASLSAGGFFLYDSLEGGGLPWEGHVGGF